MTPTKCNAEFKDECINCKHRHYCKDRINKDFRGIFWILLDDIIRFIFREKKECEVLEWEKGLDKTQN